jgi:hypothetical protein
MMDRLERFFETQGGLLFLMYSGMIFMACMTMLIVFFAPANDKAFLLFSNLLTGFASSLWTSAQIKKQRDSVDPGTSKLEVTTIKEQHELPAVDPNKEESK